MTVWFAAAAVATALWALLLLALAIATRTPDVTPGPPGGAPTDESPAVVDLITGGWRLCDEAASATLLDLAARGAVQIEEVGPELSLVRLRKAEGLNPYEQLVYEHVRSLARDDVVASGALAEGSRNLGRWWKSFRKKVIADARRRGLSRARWSRAHATLLFAAALVPAALVAVAVTLADASADSDRDGGIGAGVLAYAALVYLAGRLNGERGTDLGVQAAGHWLAVRESLSNSRFADKPAASVTIWGRPLAYAAALGLAPRAVRSLPVSVPADDRRAWSDYGGMWHAVDVRYPSRLIWGRPPLHAIGRGLAAGFFAGFWTWIVLIALSAFELWPQALAQPGGFAVGLAIAAVPAGRALLDLTGQTWIEGQIVRLRRRCSGGNENRPKYVYWCAVDEGRRRELKAYGMAEEQWSRLSEGDVVRAKAGRRVGWISEIEVLRNTTHLGHYADTRDHLIDAPRNLGEVRPGWRGQDGGMGY
ncbi:DUF2207 family protein [Nonomuraea sp. NPDC049028]|uniref:DUF2207 family protein n=1 Tax=Nonomuraea sp. NPDC049028 TaxID=3364348 RepID=UPI0037164FB2